MKTIKGNSGEWEIVVGLEVHAQVVSEAKLFSGAATAFGAAPNTQVSLVDAAMPGMLPVINKKCVEQAVRTGLGLNAKINLRSVFDRKNYFYPDLPFGYQISQFKDPIVGEGIVTLDMPDGSVREIGIERLHLEQDAGKSIHDMDPHRTYVDLNRAGVALMEIVSRPDIRGSEEAGLYVAKMRSILRYLGTCDGNMEEGSLRADVNVSVRKMGETVLGTRCEIKNVNSIRFIRQAVEIEAQRQVKILEAGGEIEQQTRLFDPARGETRAMRSKEEAHDYRFFPDPDLVPLVLDPDWVAEIKASLPELPDARLKRYTKTYDLPRDLAAKLIEDKEISDEFEEKVSRTVGYTDEQLARRLLEDKDSISEPEWATVAVSAKTVGNYTANTVFGIASELEEPVLDVLKRTDIPGVVHFVTSGEISGRQAKEVLEISAKTNASAEKIIEEKGLKQITDTGEIESILDQIIADNPDQLAQAKETPKVAGWFVGQVMKATGGKANPQVVNELLAKKLAE